MALVRLSAPQWYALALPAFVAGVLAGRGQRPAGIGLGVGLLLVGSAVIDLVNRLSDRVEDSIDYPRRAELLATVGERRLRLSIRLLVAVYLCLVLVLAALRAAAWPGVVLWLLGPFLAFAYSVGPRVKARALPSALLVASYPSLFLIWGAAQYGGGLSQVGWPALLLWLMGLSLAGWKDLANEEGDTAIGFRSVIWRLLGSRHRTARTLLFAVSPYVVVAVALMAGAVPRAAMYLALLLPFAVLYAVLVTDARTLAERWAVREYGALYFITVSGAVVTVFFPGPAVIAVSVLSLAWWIFASRFLGCDPFCLARDNLRATAGILARARRRDGGLRRRGRPAG